MRVKWEVWQAAWQQLGCPCLVNSDNRCQSNLDKRLTTFHLAQVWQELIHSAINFNWCMPSYIHISLTVTICASNPNWFTYLKIQLNSIDCGNSGVDDWDWEEQLTNVDALLSTHLFIMSAETIKVIYRWGLWAGRGLMWCWNHPQRMRSLVANSHAGHVANGDVRQVANIKRFNGFYGA